MKKLNILLVLAVMAMSFTACKKDKGSNTSDYTCTTCKTVPDAIAANNTSSKGIYKGVIIGSSGTISFNVANNGAAITALMIIDGTTVNLTSAITWVSGQPYVADFTGVLNGAAVTIHFSVSTDGTNPIVTSSNIPGHPNATLNIVKETSTSLIECFEGIYNSSKPETGTFNIILSRSLGLWTGVARAAGTTSTSNAGTGSITNNNLIDPSQNNKSIGTLNGDALNGSFVDNNGRTITIKGKRTL